MKLPELCAGIRRRRFDRRAREVLQGGNSGDKRIAKGIKTHGLSQTTSCIGHCEGITLSGLMMMSVSWCP